MHTIVLGACLASAIGYSPNSIFEIPYAAHNNAVVIQMGELARVTDEPPESSGAIGRHKDRHG